MDESTSGMRAGSSRDIAAAARGAGALASTLPSVSHTYVTAGVASSTTGRQ
jgi:hypothetical protein